MKAVQQRGSLPGVSVWQLPGLSTMDPFDSLPVDMELQSAELLYYCECHCNRDLCSDGLHDGSTLR